jgi:hypothetical protein
MATMTTKASDITNFDDNHYPMIVSMAPEPGENPYNLPAFVPVQRLFTRYRVEARARGKIMGGIPNDPETVKNWLAAKMGIDNEAELAALTRRILQERGIPISDDATLEQMKGIAEGFGEERHTNGFMRDATGLYLENRNVKAMFKEVCNILYAGERWGTTRKGPKAYLAERVFICEERIYLGRAEADGVQQVIGHVPSPQGPKSTLTRFEYVEGAAFAFTAMSLRDCIEPDQWGEMLTLAQENGIGAVRSQSFGTFDVLRFGKVG